MGRGRAKAKQQKVARELKYGGSQHTDLDALQRELGGASPPEVVETDEDEDDDYGDWQSTGR